ncbi:MAG: ribonucleoside triphosphate reductase [bacterium]
MGAYSKKKNSYNDVIEVVEEYLYQGDWRIKENANMGYSWHGLSDYISSKVQSNYFLNKIYPKEISEAHINGDIHIHDLQYLTTYCNGWDIGDLLNTGYTGVPGKVEFAPAKHFDSALNQLKNFLYTVRYESAGAQAVSNLDTYLAPFIGRDKLTYREVKQCVQEFIYNLNVPLDKGFQAPFTNVTLDIRPTKKMGAEHVIIGGVPQKERYGDFQREMYMFNRAYAEVMMEGDKSGRVFTWPIPTYNITKDFPWDEPRLKPIWEMTAKFGIPYFSNFVNSDMKPDDTRSMCCRLRIDNRELIRRGGGLFGSDPLTGSIGVVTINLARIGYLTRTQDRFFKRLRMLMDIAKESLMIKRELLEDLSDRGLYPYSSFYLRNIKKRFGRYWKNHFNTIGILGMNEACLNHMGKGIQSEEGKKFTIEVLDFMRKVLKEYQKETGEMFNLEATPGEGATYRFAKTDRKLFPEIIVANHDEAEKGAAPFYTNSTHLPVDFTDDLFEALDHQDELQTKYTGGTVLHAFLGEKLPNEESAKNLVKKISENYRLPYFSITPTFSICPKHGYLSGEHEYCPKCDDEIGYKEKK